MHSLRSAAAFRGINVWDGNQEALWESVSKAGSFDPSIDLSRIDYDRMMARYVPPQEYSRERLFEAMANREPAVLVGHPSPVRSPLDVLGLRDAAHCIVKRMAESSDEATYSVVMRAEGRRVQLRPCEIAELWQKQTEVFGISDLYIRNTFMEELIDPSRLSSFNLLLKASDKARSQEMFSFVISAEGMVTDSHSDDPDSSNFCLEGRKLWIFWDTYAGLAAGLQDVERLLLTTSPQFDMKVWLSMPSARWCIVGPNDTLFLPANFTHKVITLEHYVGVGGFYVSLPNCLSLIADWIYRGPLWSKLDRKSSKAMLIGDIALAVQKTILRLRDCDLAIGQALGYDFLELAAQNVIRRLPQSQMAMLWSDPRFRNIADNIAAPWPFSNNVPLAFQLGKQSIPEHLQQTTARHRFNRVP
ncbi:hypothetical protein EN925_05635 [Mesorhizobium sp. M7A.F.Ca.US.006.04.2.1]|uniref:hypothetical protein n=1 Tax=unclassified Mesorhizobium TaxID=325217 RepID=UPI000FCB6051|nr:MULTISPECIES: hypothetical protein [unclassified Mesorhizobium]RUX69950.1 hypothetical protein EN990_33165 [Mesorhizobium sp. M7A.F.Ca.US.005.03.1.1]RUY16697.1 hypothetical protein EN991_10460 [Mesorhizobium sp. M7A.F.Ca.US.005.03.2.1]RUY28959.1 hypothetical protein EN979_11725 [Mesorhizobium sp. M7A.F.Ca.US.001.04.2.1]RUY41469.1 hypothetical protein EN978_15220 [Mesorhizobium sp. M7A.F.Ca.US.001.04.1.1]RVA94650.1 hypothetical protein EN925_05635 [Mesorhizobium sp. M7A.F.Ca.US.006.04.2.1]